MIESVQRNDIDYYLPNDILVKVDRASMSNSLEVRSPFLNHKLVNEAFKLPTELKLRNKTTKYILKNLLSNLSLNLLYLDLRWGLPFQLKDGCRTRNLEKLWTIYLMSQVGREFGWNQKKILKKWLDYKKYGSSTPQSIWMYAMAGLWLNKWR